MIFNEEKVREIVNCKICFYNLMKMLHFVVNKVLLIVIIAQIFVLNNPRHCLQNIQKFD